ncbi:hypothetical protein BDZ91DRAFT_793966 [Kalaharituber pfeilii]|nr:hypothetical protein BDZ91DRAFT_793966 [Kalaharituber pfeilii]
MPLFESLGPAHLLIFGTSFGTQVYQTFISGPIAYKYLTRPQFSQLQTGIFPIYFALQTAIPPILLLTLPPSAAVPSNVLDILTPPQIPPGPAVTRIMDQRKKVTAECPVEAEKMAGDKSETIKKLNKKFARAHGASSVLNLVGLIATGWFGWGLGKRLGAL